ncbi:hypothetical protein BGZ67_001320 [Mortierella alpina]|nr:hypothetical protein BGZ67_001320 [Mortierella alpina]
MGNKDGKNDKDIGKGKGGAGEKDRGDTVEEHPATGDNEDLGDDNDNARDGKEGHAEDGKEGDAEDGKEGDAEDGKEGDAEDGKEGDAEDGKEGDAEDGEDGSESHDEEDGQDERDGSKNNEGSSGEDHSSTDGDKDTIGQGDQGSQGPNTGGGSEAENPGLDAHPGGTLPGTGGSDATPTDPQAKVPSPANQNIPGTPFFTDSGSSLPVAPSIPVPGNSNTNQAISTKPGSTPADKESGTKIIAYTLIPLTVIAAVAYGVIAYRRRNTRRRALRRRLQEDAEAAAIAASRPPGGEDDDAASVMSEISYRPPAPYTSEVDITTESMEKNPEVVTGDAAQHLISAPKRAEAREGDYQDYSHVCQAQMMGKTCTNHSISCFVALNHSNAGLSSSAAPRKPSTDSSRALDSLGQIALPEHPEPSRNSS